MNNTKLAEYLNNEILPIYDTFDKGHNRDHIEDVARNSIELVKTIKDNKLFNEEINLDMVLAAAYFHDLGMPQGRATHHLTSAVLLREDNFINHYFDSAQIETIAQAIEDHRASSKTDPRSIYGKILSSADRIIIPNTIIIRTYYYGLDHYPNISHAEQLERIYEHISIKYGKGGYLRVPILTKANSEALERLQTLISDKQSFLAYTEDLVTKND